MSSNCGALFREYIRICNEALEANKDCYPYPRVMRQIEGRLCDHPVQVVIYDEHENQSEAVYDMVMEGQRLAIQPPHKKPPVKHPWLVSRHYLEEVTQHPQTYISNPAQLDWKWLNCHDVGV